MDERESIRCSECNSTMTYLRIKTNQRVCRTCGNVEDLNIIEKEVIKDDIGIEKKEERTI